MGVGWHRSQGYSHRDWILVQISQEQNIKSLIGSLQKLTVQVQGPEIVYEECDCVRAAGARTRRIMGLVKDIWMAPQSWLARLARSAVAASNRCQLQDNGIKILSIHCFLYLLDGVTAR